MLRKPVNFKSALRAAAANRHKIPQRGYRLCSSRRHAKATTCITVSETTQGRTPNGDAVARHGVSISGVACMGLSGETGTQSLKLSAMLLSCRRSCLAAMDAWLKAEMAFGGVKMGSANSIDLQ